jgi:hypothetical protein
LPAIDSKVTAFAVAVRSRLKYGDRLPANASSSTSLPTAHLTSVRIDVLATRSQQPDQQRAEQLPGELLKLPCGGGRRAAADKRRLRLLYFSDFDPAGWQMPISVARKLQAHRCREFPDLDVRVIRVALNVDQVIEFGLPDSPIKPGEKRARGWRERWGREQVEIDALAALRPELLDQIARRAVARYFDVKFEQRYTAEVQVPKKHTTWFQKLPEYKQAKALIEKQHEAAVDALSALKDAKDEALDVLSQIVESKAPALSDVVVEPKLADDEGEENIIFDSSDDFVTATMKLKALKALDSEADDDEALAEADDEEDAE